MNSLYRFSKSTKGLFFMLLFLFCTVSLISFYITYYALAAYQTKQLNTTLLEALTIRLVNEIRVLDLAEGPYSVEEREKLSSLVRLLGIHAQITNLSHEEVWFTTYDAINTPKAPAVTMVLIAGGERKSFVKTSYPREGALHQLSNQKINELSSMLFFSLSLLLIFMFLLSGISASSLAKRLRPAAEAIEQIRLGARDIKVPESGNVDVQQMVLTINELMNEINNHEGMRRQLVQDLAHELRTPITSMLSGIEAMIDGIYPINEEYLSSIYEELERLTRMVNDMEQLSDAEGARFSLRPKNEDMTRMARSVYQNFLPIAREKRIKLIFIPAHTPCYAEVDSDRVIQIIYNLLSNAIKYTPYDGRVTLGVLCSEQHAVIYCDDNGIGITVEDKKRIFDRLYRVDKSRSRESGGLGVGLSIVKALVDAHDGRIEVDSRPHRGSTFRVILPKVYKQLDKL